MADFYRGRFFDPFDKTHKPEDLGEFINSVPISDIKRDIFEYLLPEIKKQQEISSLGIAGFCWGALPVFTAC